MGKIKGFVLDHGEKVVLALFVVGGFNHLFHALSARPEAITRAQMIHLKGRVLEIQRTSHPEDLTVPSYISRMRASFVRVPPIEVADSWRWYPFPEVSDRAVLHEGDAVDLRMNLVQEVSKIQFLEGEHLVDVRQNTDGSVKVIAIRVGTAVIVCHSKNGTKEMWTIPVIPERTRNPLKRAWPPTRIEPVAVRGAIRVYARLNPLNHDQVKALLPYGYHIYRKKGQDGAWVRIHVKLAERPASPETPSANVSDETLPPVPSAAVTPRPTETSDGGVRSDRNSTEVTRRTDYVEFLDRDVRPDTTYFYSATVLSKTIETSDREDDLIESKVEECVSTAVVSKSDLEIRLVGTFNGAANVRVRKWFSDTDFNEKLFSVPVGDRIGGVRRVKIGDEAKQLDFSTGSTLVDVSATVRTATYVRRSVPVLDASGRARIGERGLDREEILIPKLSLGPKIVVLDGKGRIREYVRE